jgi:hypothetical protein
MKRILYVLLCAVLCLTGCNKSQNTDQAAAAGQPAAVSGAEQAADGETTAAVSVQMLDYNKDLTKAV